MVCGAVVGSAPSVWRGFRGSCTCFADCPRGAQDPVLGMAPLGDSLSQGCPAQGRATSRDSPIRHSQFQGCPAQGTQSEAHTSFAALRPPDGQPQRPEGVWFPNGTGPSSPCAQTGPSYLPQASLCHFCLLSYLLGHILCMHIAQKITLVFGFFFLIVSAPCVSWGKS